MAHAKAPYEAPLEIPSASSSDCFTCDDMHGHIGFTEQNETERFV